MMAALIVVAGGVSGLEETATAAEMALFIEYGRLEAAKDTDGLINLGVHVWGDGPTQPEGRAAAGVRERLREMIANNYRLHREKLQPRPLDPSAASRLGEIQIPALVISGGFDFTGTNAAMDYLAEHVAGAQRVVFPDTAHMVNMEQPERFNTVVLDFLAKH